MSDPASASPSIALAGEARDRAAALARRYDWLADAGIAREELGLITRLLRVDLFVSNLLERVASDHDISVSDFMVIAAMRRGLTSPAELCRVLGRTTGGMTLTIDRLIAAGYVERTPDPSDRRRIIVNVTDSGREKALAINTALHEWEASLGLSDEALDRIGETLDEVSFYITPDSGR